MTTSIPHPKCPNTFTIDFGRELVEYLGGNPDAIQDNWCWKELGKQYLELQGRAERYFEAAETGNPTYAAYQICRNCGSDREWAEKVIETAQTGDPALTAYRMCRNCGSASEWAEGIIETARIGDPAGAAHLMCRDCNSTREWAEGVKRRWRERKADNDD